MEAVEAVGQENQEKALFYKCIKICFLINSDFISDLQSVIMWLEKNEKTPSWLKVVEGLKAEE